MYNTNSMNADTITSRWLSCSAMPRYRRGGRGARQAMSSGVIKDEHKEAPTGC